MWFKHMPLFFEPCYITEEILQDSGEWDELWKWGLRQKSLGREFFYSAVKHYVYLMAYIKKKKNLKNNRTRASAEILATLKSIPRFLLTSGGVKATDNGRNKAIQRIWSTKEEAIWNTTGCNHKGLYCQKTGRNYKNAKQNRNGVFHLYSLPQQTHPG